MPSPAFYEHTLPLMMTILVAAGTAVWAMIWGMRGIDKRLDSIERRLERIEAKLDSHSERISKVEERTSVIHH